MIPKSLQRKTVEAAHRLGYLGITKTKSMLMERFLIPQMNSIVTESVKRCFECQVATTVNFHEPIKMSAMPKDTWETVFNNFAAPYLDGDYNLVANDGKITQLCTYCNLQPATQQ